MIEKLHKLVSIAKDYSRFPAGRYPTDGPFNGERFRDELLVPALHDYQVVEVDLDGVRGFGSSFLDEAFGGLIRHEIIEKNAVSNRLRLRSSDESLVEEIHGYIEDAVPGER